MCNIICSFKNGKAPPISNAQQRGHVCHAAHDIHGLTAEHLKYAVDEVCRPLAELRNYNLSCGYILPMMLDGLVTPIPKKDKDANPLNELQGYYSLVHYCESVGKDVPHCK